MAKKTDYRKIRPEVWSVWQTYKQSEFDAKKTSLVPFVAGFNSGHDHSSEVIRKESEVNAARVSDLIGFA